MKVYVLTMTFRGVRHAPILAPSPFVCRDAWLERPQAKAEGVEMSIKP